MAKIQLEIPDELHVRIKMCALEDGCTMKRWLQDVLWQCVGGEKGGSGDADKDSQGVTPGAEGISGAE